MNERMEEKQEELNVFQVYLDEIGGIRECSENENRELAEQIRNGNDEAKKRLIEGNLKRALGLTREYFNRGVAVGDLVQEANMALVMAVSDLEEKLLEGGFEIFLENRVREALKHAVEEQETENKVEEMLLARVNVLEKVTRSMAEELGREATAEELAERMKMTVDEVKDIMKQTLDAMSITGEYDQTLSDAALEDS